MSVFDSIPYTDQAAMLVTSISGGDGEGEDELSKMTEIYKQQDIAGMQQMSNQRHGRRNKDVLLFGY